MRRLLGAGALPSPTRVIRVSWAIGIVLGWIAGCTASAREIASEQQPSPAYRDVALPGRMLNVAETQRTQSENGSVSPPHPVGREQPPVDPAAPTAVPGTYLVLSTVVQLRGEGKSGAHALDEHEVADAVTSVFAFRSAAEVISPVGRERLRQEVQRAVEAVTPPGVGVTRVLFTDYLVRDLSPLAEALRFAPGE